LASRSLGPCCFGRISWLNKRLEDLPNNSMQRPALRAAADAARWAADEGWAARETE